MLPGSIGRICAPYRLNNDQALRAIVETGNSMPSTRTLAVDPVWTRPSGPLPNRKVFTDGMPNLRPDPLLYNFADVNEAMDAQLQRLWQGDVAAPAAAVEIKRTVDPLLQQGKRELRSGAQGAQVDTHVPGRSAVVGAVATITSTFPQPRRPGSAAAGGDVPVLEGGLAVLEAITRRRTGLGSGSCGRAKPDTTRWHAPAAGRGGGARRGRGGPDVARRTERMPPGRGGAPGPAAGPGRPGAHLEPAGLPARGWTGSRRWVASGGSRTDYRTVALLLADRIRAPRSLPGGRARPRGGRGCRVTSRDLRSTPSRTSRSSTGTTSSSTVPTAPRRSRA